MSVTPSTMPPLGTPAPEFTLPDPDGNKHSFSTKAKGKPVLVAFLCNHCPYVKHIADEFAMFANQYVMRGLAVIGINPNEGVVEADSADAMREEAEQRGYPFPYLIDGDQSVAKAYKAACTPDFFLYDADHKLVYRGRFDAAKPGSNEPVTGKDLRAAADAVLAGEKPSEDQRNSVGCNIKWAPGNAPSYFK